MLHLSKDKTYLHTIFNFHISKNNLAIHYNVSNICNNSIQQYGIMPVIVTSSKSYYAVGFEEHQDILLMNIAKKTSILVATGYPYTKMRVALNDEILAVCSDPVGNYGKAINTNLKVFSNKTTDLLLQESMERFIAFSTDGLGDQTSLVIIYNTKIEIFKFEDNNLKSRFQVSVSISKLYINSCINPFISYCEVINEKSQEEKFSMSVWKFNTEFTSITIQINVEDIKKFAFQNDEQDSEVYNGTYFTENFFVFAISFIKDDRIFCITRIINESGEKIRDLDLDVLEVSNQETVFYKVILRN